MSDVVKSIVVAVVCAAIAGVFAFSILWLAEDKEKRERFEGACLYLKGEVKDDVCVRDGEVILTRNDLED